MFNVCEKLNFKKKGKNGGAKSAAAVKVRGEASAGSEKTGADLSAGSLLHQKLTLSISSEGCLGGKRRGKTGPSLPLSPPSLANRHRRRCRSRFLCPVLS